MTRLQRPVSKGASTTLHCISAASFLPPPEARTPKDLSQLTRAGDASGGGTLLLTSSSGEKDRSSPVTRLEGRARSEVRDMEGDKENLVGEAERRDAVRRRLHRPWPGGGTNTGQRIDGAGNVTLDIWTMCTMSSVVAIHFTWPAQRIVLAVRPRMRMRVVD